MPTDDMEWISKLPGQLDFLKELVAEIRASGYRRPVPVRKRFTRVKLWWLARQLDKQIVEGESILQKTLIALGAPND
jgi:hypothetical protein